MKKSSIIRTLTSLALILALMFTLAACGGKQAEPQAEAPAEGEKVSYNIGYNTWGAGSATFDWQAGVLEDALTAYDATFSRASDDHMADKELQNIQNFISAGVDGLVMMTTADPVLPQAAAECAEAKIPFVLAVFTGDDADRAKINAENDFYLGAVNADMYAEGYLMGKAAADDGHKTVVMLGGNVGDNHMEQRIAGFTQAFVTEGGGEIIDEARCASPAEGQEKANAMLSAHPDADCLFAMVGDYTPGAVNAMETLGISMPIYVTNANTDNIPYIRGGQVVAGAGGNDLVVALSAALLINYLDGHQILDENGNPPELKFVSFKVDASNIDVFEQVFLSDNPLTAERLQTLVYRYNPDVTYDTFVETLSSYLTLESMAADLAK